MSKGSIRVRLIAATSIATSVALGIAGIGFYYLFQKHVEKLTLEEFESQFTQLASIVSVDDAGQLVADGDLSDPRFSQQLSGYYWQIDVKGKPVLRSRSLWDQQLSVPTPPEEGEEEAHIHTLPGPNDMELISLEKLLTFEKPDGTTLNTVVTIGKDRAAVTNAVSAFSNELTAGLGLLYLTLLASSLLQILFGLKPLQQLRDTLQRVRNGDDNRMKGEFPSEVAPLVGEFNSLLEAREKQVEKARGRAGNLAHGFKTPLTVLEAIAGELRKTGMKDAAAGIQSATLDMRVLVERELMRARASAERGKSKTPLLATATRIRDALTKGSEREIKWSLNVRPSDTVPFEQSDLFELLGNLMENAHKFARTSAYVSTASGSIVVEDDGKGVPNDMLSQISRRGVKLDEQAPGTGLGLAIVTDLAEAYGATVAFAPSSHGGLKVTVTPAHSAAPEATPDSHPKFEAGVAALVQPNTGFTPTKLGR